jgi:hypothetical protein
MSISEKSKLIALAIVHVFETSRPFGDYSAYVVLDDGAGVSYGINQFTHKSGSLLKVVERYIENGGTASSSVLESSIDLLEMRSPKAIETLAGNSAFKAALKAAGKTPEMRLAQRQVMETMYLIPAIQACEDSHFELPLSLAVVYDSMNHGSYSTGAKIRDRVTVNRSQYASNEKFEKAWVADYCHERLAWLKTKTGSLRNSVYRPQFFLDQIVAGNWGLELPLIVHGVHLTEKMFQVSADAPAVKPTDLDPSKIPSDVVRESLPEIGQPPNSTQVTAKKETETATGTESVEVTTKNELDVHEPATVDAPEPYEGIGFWAVIKRDLTFATGGNLSISTLSDYATQSSGWPPWVVAIISKIAVGLLIATVAYFIFRVIHFTADTWKKSRKAHTDALINSDVSRKNIEWKPAQPQPERTFLGIKNELRHLSRNHRRRIARRLHDLHDHRAESQTCRQAAADNYAAIQMQSIINTLTDDRAAVPGEMPRILARPGKITDEVLAGIREGFRERIAKARDVMGWTYDLDPAQYTVMIFPSVRDYDLDGVYSPVFQTFFNAGNSYDESQYDQEPGKPGGWTYAAEQVLVNGSQLLNIFIIAENNTAEYSARVTSYALDHLFPYHNDFDLYSATADHSQGNNPHPLW